MEREQVIAILKQHEAELRARGVEHVALFGSTARGDARPDSDVDLLVDLRSGAPIGVFEYVGITQLIADLFPVRVDVANHTRLKAHVRPAAEREAVYAF